MSKDNSVYVNKDHMFIYNTLIKLIKDAVRDALNDGSIRIEELDVESAFCDYIAVQFYHNEYYNRVFVEFDLSNTLIGKYHEDRARIIDFITNYIKSNFFRITGCYPELILPDDGVNERIDSSRILTPFVIGYWKCIGGNYEFLYSNIAVLHDVEGINIATYDSNFYTELQEIYAKYYYSDFDMFLTKLLELDDKYNIDINKKPDKKIEDFFILVKELSDQYKQVVLTDEQKTDYINEYNDIYINYHSDKSTFDTKLQELYDKYNIKTQLNSYIPEIMEKYTKIYKDFFGKDLYNINDNVYRKYLVLK